MFFDQVLLNFSEIGNFNQKVDGKMVFTWCFGAFHDIPGFGKYGFSCGGRN